MERDVEGWLTLEDWATRQYGHEWRPPTAVLIAWARGRLIVPPPVRTRQGWRVAPDAQHRDLRSDV